jgi:hypothetical protein
MDEFYRDQRAGAGRQLVDLLCVALLGLILTLAAGAISRAPAAAAAPGAHGDRAHADKTGKADADCAAPVTADQASAKAFPGGAALPACGDGKTPAAPTAH